MDVKGYCLVKARAAAGAAEYRSERERVRERWGHGEGGPDEPTTPVAELEGRLACLELSHPVSGSSPMPAQPATPAQLKLPRLLFRAQPMHVLPTAD